MKPYLLAPADHYVGWLYATNAVKGYVIRGLIVSLVVVAYVAYAEWELDFSFISYGVDIACTFVFFILLETLATFLRFRGVRRYYARAGKEDKFGAHEIKAGWDSETIHFEQDLSTSRFPWSYFIRAKETPTHFVLILSGIRYCVLPKSAFDSEAEMQDLRSRIPALAQQAK